ncbi:putative E3 ubiquitin-protein ligase LIN-1 [Rutidosis leptorrhynchoides]|uniref:putative E3 ubiquitin-protein ligase LIN-1 n=1 Tax=Rutidosis leptorrhynchoides TaxID=125765 RepID=UPI003A98E739
MHQDNKHMVMLCRADQSKFAAFCNAQTSSRSGTYHHNHKSVDRTGIHPTDEFLCYAFPNDGWGAGGDGGDGGQNNRGKREKTQNIGLRKLRNAHGKLPIDFDIKLKTINPIDDNSAMFVNLISSVVRKPSFPKYYKCWADVPSSFKDDVWVDIRNYFQIDTWLEGEHAASIRAGINKIAASRRKNAKSEYIGYYEFLEEEYPNDINFIRANAPEDCEPREWEPFVDMMLDETYRKRCAQNKLNRAEVKYNSLHGAKSIVKHLHERQAKDARVGPIKNYKLLHKPKDVTKWNDSFIPKKNYKDMKRLLKEFPGTDEELIMEQVLGERPGHQRGLGPKMPKSVSNSESSSSTGRSRQPEIPPQPYYTAADIERIIAFNNMQIPDDVRPRFGYPPGTSTTGTSNTGTSTSANPSSNHDFDDDLYNDGFAGFSFVNVLETAILCRIIRLETQKQKLLKMQITAFPDDKSSGKSRPGRQTTNSSGPISFIVSGPFPIVTFNIGSIMGRNGGKEVVPTSVESDTSFCIIESFFHYVCANLSFFMEDIESQNTPPKDFVCPITKLIFNDPVTLETGQTYEREAIQEWIDRGNSTCPITHQKLHNLQLPKTNFVLKRLIANWKELTPHKEFQFEENNHVAHPISPKSVISRETNDGTINELRAVITDLCTSQVLKKAELAVLKIERFWQEKNKEVEIQNMLSKLPVINGFVEILFSSVDTRVLKATVYLLSEMGSIDKEVISTLTRVYSDVECVVSLFKKGLSEAVVLIYLLKPSISTFLITDIANELLTVIQKREDEFLKMCMKPKSASVLLLAQILENEDDNAILEVIRSLVSSKAIESIIKSVESESIEERIAVLRILLRCIHDDGKCRNVIADKAELAPVLESFVHANDQERFKIVQFLSELVKLNRRTFNNQVLHIIKDEGTFSTMHTLLIYLQTALTEQIPIVAGLLLQLDLLVEPRKMSIYREEAIDSLISCLKNTDSPATQIAAADTLMELQGRFSYSGKPLVRKFLLKCAGLDKNYRSTMRSGDVQETMEEEKAAEEWEKKMAFVLVNHEFGIIFEALSEGLRSRYAEICSGSFISATWLLHMLTHLPDTGIQETARVCLLKRFVSIFKSAKDTEDKALSMLALSCFMHDKEGLRDMTIYAKDICKGLREFKKSSAVACKMLKLFSEESESSPELWNHIEIGQEDCSANGVVLSLVCKKDKIFSGHSDGTIKVWTGKSSGKGKSSMLHLIQEVQEHTKAVTSLTVLPSGNTLYSGSHDKTIRVWSINKEGIHCEEVYDVKEHVNNLLVANNISCFIPQGAGIKVNSWNGESKLLNPSKDVKCLDLVNGRLYSGCLDNSIQEIDLATGTLTTIQNGSRKLLAKGSRVNVLQVHDGLIYAASSSIEGTTFKIWSASTYSLIQSQLLSSEVRAMAISSDFIYFGCKTGMVEVWCRNKLVRRETLKIGTNCKAVCMAIDSTEDVLVIGTSDGRVQVWGVS